MSSNSFLRKRLDPEQRYGLRLTLFVIAVLLVAVPFGILLREVTQEGPMTRIDTSAARNLHEAVLDSPWLVTLLQAVSFVGSPVWFYFVTGIAAIWMWRQGHPRLALFLIVTGLLGGLIDSIVKIIVDRPRPSLEQPVATAHGKSFPSGHSMSSVIGYGTLLLVFLPVIPRRWRIAAIAGSVCLVLAIGFSRLALGVHYISDVLGGYALGLAWLVASTAAFSIWRVERGKKKVEPTEGLAPEAL
jgi:undecaprenyl-diphosphatase